MYESVIRNADGQTLTLKYHEGQAHSTESMYSGRFFRDMGDGRLYEILDDGRLGDDVWEYAD